MAKMYDYQLPVVHSEIYSSNVGYILCQDQPRHDSFLVGLDAPGCSAIYYSVSYATVFQLDELREFVRDVDRLIMYNTYNVDRVTVINLRSQLDASIKIRVYSGDKYLTLQMRYLETSKWLSMNLSLSEAQAFVDNLSELLVRLESNEYTVDARRRYGLETVYRY